MLLAEIKGDHLLNSDDTLDKVLAGHQLYKRPVMLMRKDSGRSITKRKIEALEIALIKVQATASSSQKIRRTYG